MKPGEDASLDLFLPSTRADFKVTMDWGDSEPLGSFTFPVSLSPAPDSRSAKSSSKLHLSVIDNSRAQVELARYLEMPEWELAASGLDKQDRERIAAIRADASLGQTSDQMAFSISGIHPGHYLITIELGEIVVSSPGKEPVSKTVLYRKDLDLTASPQGPIVLDVDWDATYDRAIAEASKGF